MKEASSTEIPVIKRRFKISPPSRLFALNRLANESHTRRDPELPSPRLQGEGRGVRENLILPASPSAAPSAAALVFEARFELRLLQRLQVGHVFRLGERAFELVQLC